jgi:hypothetical protein
MRFSKRLGIIALLLPVLFNLASIPIAIAQQQIIDSDIKTGDKLKVVVMFYKDTGEIDPNWDYYSIRIQIEDIYSKNDPYVNPGDANVWVNCPSQAQEAPINHKPTAGFYSGERARVSSMKWRELFAKTEQRHIVRLPCRKRVKRPRKTTSFERT